MRIALISGAGRFDILWRAAGYQGEVAAQCCRRLSVSRCYRNLNEYDVIIGHSAGGIVAKMAVVLGEARPKAVFTISTPHKPMPYLKWSPVLRDMGDRDISRILEESWPSDVPIFNFYGAFDILVPFPFAKSNIINIKQFKLATGHLGAVHQAKGIIYEQIRQHS